MPATKLDMLLDRVDHQDRVVGQVLRRDVFALRASFRVVHVLIFSHAGELLIQQIPPRHPRHGGWYGSSVAGYVQAGESYETAALRKVKEEIGVAPLLLHALGTTSMIDDGTEKFIGVYTAVSDGPFSPNPAEAAGVAFISLVALQAAITRGDPVTPTFLHVLNFVRARGIP